MFHIDDFWLQMFLIDMSNNKDTRINFVVSDNNMA